METSHQATRKPKPAQAEKLHAWRGPRGEEPEATSPQPTSTSRLGGDEPADEGYAHDHHSCTPLSFGIISYVAIVTGTFPITLISNERTQTQRIQSMTVCVSFTLWLLILAAGIRARTHWMGKPRHKAQPPWVHIVRESQSQPSGLTLRTTT